MSEETGDPPNQPEPLSLAKSKSSLKSVKNLQEQTESEPTAQDQPRLSKLSQVQKSTTFIVGDVVEGGDQGTLKEVKSSASQTLKKSQSGIRSQKNVADQKADDATNFKDVGFDKALTKEEKKVLKDAKLKAKQEKKGKLPKKRRSKVKVKGDEEDEWEGEGQEQEQMPTYDLQGVILSDKILADRKKIAKAKTKRKRSVIKFAKEASVRRIGSSSTKTAGKSKSGKKGKDVKSLSKIDKSLEGLQTALSASELLKASLSGFVEGEEADGNAGESEDEEGEEKRGKLKRKRSKSKSIVSVKGKTSSRRLSRKRSTGKEVIEGEDDGEGEGGGQKRKKLARKKSSKLSRSQMAFGSGEASLVKIQTRTKSMSGSFRRRRSSVRRQSRVSRTSKMFRKSSQFSASSSDSSEEVFDTLEQQGEALEAKESGTEKGKKKGKKGKKGKDKAEGEAEGEAKPQEKVPPKKTEEAKGKKKKTEKKAEGKAEEKPKDEEEDVFAQIQKMKEEADKAIGAGSAVDTTAAPKKKEKKKKKQPKKKKEKVKYDPKKVEEARIKAEKEVQAALQKEKEHQEYLKKLAKEKDKKDVVEQALRVDQLMATAAWIKSMLDYNWDLSYKEKADNEWTQYLKCDGLPDPASPAEMNTYLHLWDKGINDVTPEECSRRTDEVLKLLSELNDFIDDPFDVRENTIEDWCFVRKLCRATLQLNNDMATYRLLRDIDNRLNRIDIPTADYRIVNDNFTLCLWLMVQLATPMENPRTPAKPRLNVKFPEINFEVLFPDAVEGRMVAVRGVYLKYDHFSDTCASYNGPSVPLDYQIDLLEATNSEWYVRMMYKYNNRKKERIMIEDKDGDLVPGPDEVPDVELQEGELPPTVPFQMLDPTASSYAIKVEDETYKKNRMALCNLVPSNATLINLRKFLIVGGSFSLNFFYQPPQPYGLVSIDLRLTRLITPKTLAEVPFTARYNPPAPEDPENKKTPEELEEEMKSQEEEMDHLLLYTIKLPDHVMFLDLPTICTWDSKNLSWSTKDVYDVRHIEEKNLVMFRSIRFGFFSFAVNRFLNFPFQAWELKPEPDRTVTLQLTCAILMVEFNVKGNTVCLTQLQNSPNNALQEIIGHYYKLPKLIRVLREGGVDLFPSFDAFCYVESGICEKHYPLEKHLYYTMGLMSCRFNFTWSRWNVQASRRNIIMQIREFHHDRPKQQDFQMLLVTPLKATYVDTTEISQSFSEEPKAGMKFCSDLFHLMKATTTMSTKDKVAQGPLDVAKTVSDLLIATRIHSFS